MSARCARPLMRYVNKVQGGGGGGGGGGVLGKEEAGCRINGTRPLISLQSEQDLSDRPK